VTGLAVSSAGEVKSMENRFEVDGNSRQVFGLVFKRKPTEEDVEQWP